MEEEKILEKYSLIVNNVRADVEIISTTKDYVPIYFLRMPVLEKGTLALLQEIREKLISILQIKISELMDPKAYEELKERFFKKAIKLIKKELPNLSEPKMKTLAGLLLHEMLGLGKIEILLADGNLEEVVVNGSKEPVWVYHKKYGWLKTNITIPSETQIQNYAASIARRVGRQITTLDPLLDAHLVTGDRVNATLFPISATGNTLTIRMFRRKPWTITDLIENKTVSLEVAALVWLAVQYEMSMIVSGGTASGKTSFLSAIMPFIPPNHRVISIEDTREINLPRFLHWVPLVTREPNPEGLGEVCVFPGSYFIVENGELHEISEFYEELRRKENPKKLMKNVEVIDGSSFSILAGDPRSLTYKAENVKSFSKITEQDKICTIELEDGSIFKITKNTKIPVFVGKLNLLTPIELAKVKESAFIPVLTRIRIPGKYQKLKIFDIFGDGDFYVVGISRLLSRLLEKLKKKFKLKEILRKCNLSKGGLYWYKKKGMMKVSVLKKLLDLAGFRLDAIDETFRYIKPRGYNGKPVKIPLIVDEDLSYLVGFLLAEKFIGKNHIRVVQKENIDYVLDGLFKKCFEFDLLKKEGKYRSYFIFSRVITHLMKKVFNLTLSKRVEVPKIIMRSPETVIAAFLAGYIDGDGSVSKGKVSLSCSNERAIHQFKYLLLRLGMMGKVSKESRVFSINICTRRDLEKACSLLPFRIKRNVQKAKQNLMTTFKEGSRRGRIPFSFISNEMSILKDYLTVRERYRYFYRYSENKDKLISRERLSEALSILSNRVHSTPEERRSIEKLKKLIESEIEFVKVKRISIEENKDNIPSYDITPSNSEYILISCGGAFTWIQDTMLDLLVNSLRMRPDRIIVAEIRRQRQAEVLFEAMHTGHSVYATLHADTVEQTYRRLVNPPINVPETLLEALDMIVTMFRDRRTGRRRVYEVAELVPATGKTGLTIRILYKWDPRKDQIVKFQESFRLMKKLEMHTGMTQKEIQKDLQDKQKILAWMVKHKVNTVDAVGKIVAEYYRDPKVILEAVEKDEKPEKLIPKELLEG